MGGNVLLVNILVGVIVQVVDDIGLLLGQPHVFHTAVFQLNHQVGKLLHLGAYFFAFYSHGTHPFFCTKLQYNKVYDRFFLHQSQGKNYRVKKYL